ncbi:MAG: c-type cytochrome biogenesis protein CcmI [Pseudomonadota bacterium]
MILWGAFGLLLALTLAVLLRPLLRPSATEPSGEDREIYAAQLKEMDADRERGLIGDAEAGATRAEIARRLLRARDNGRTPSQDRRRALATALALAVFVPVFSIGAYLFMGTPDYGDQPLAARLGPMDEEELQRLVASAEARLAQTPDDVRGWIAVAPVYRRLGRFSDAARAYGRVNALAGESVEWLEAQGESLTYANEGEVSQDAKALFERAVELDPETLRSTIFLAIEARQGQRFDEAAQRWRALIARSNGNEPWLEIASAEFLRMGLAQPSGGDEVATGTARAATAETLAGSSPPPGVTAMVEGLAQRLDAQGGSVEEWVRLVRSYTVLGRADDAKAAVAAGMAALSKDDRTAFANAPEVKAVTQ